MTAPNPTAALLQSLVEAQRIARGVEKTSTNTFHKYNYAGTESIILEAKDAMAQTGLALIPRGARMFSIGTRMDVGLDPRTPREVPQLFIARRWSLVHQGGGILELEEQVWPVVPDKGRPLDKAVAAADTASLGYLLRNVLMLARVEEGTDLDHDSRDEHRRQEEPKQAPPATSEQRRAIMQVLEEAGIARVDVGRWVADAVGHGNALTFAEAEGVLEMAKAKKTELAAVAETKARAAAKNGTTKQA